MQKVKLQEIIPDKNQPRKYFAIEKMASLKDSIKRHGIITPLIVQKEGNKFMLIDGERRFRVAMELGLKEVPVQVVEAKNDFNRLVEQFHLQEQHAEWSMTEKAMAVLEICKISNKSVKEVCELLSIENRTFRLYFAFSRLQDKERFLEYQCSIYNAEKIIEMKGFVRKIKEEVLNEPFTKAQELILERALIEKIKEGEIDQKGSYSKLKDIFRTDPKTIDEFMKDANKFDVNLKFVNTKARGARAVRNMLYSAHYVSANASNFLKEKNVKLSDVDIAVLKSCAKSIKEVLNLVE